MTSDEILNHHWVIEMETPDVQCHYLTLLQEIAYQLAVMNESNGARLKSVVETK